MEIEVDLARAEIQRLLQSKSFETSEAHRRLLRYLAEKSLAGEADGLKEYTVGLEAFGKASTYDPQEDSIVRTQASRLRLKLFDYYKSEGKGDPVLVDLPKGGFKILFHERERDEIETVPGVTRQPRELQTPVHAGTTRRPSSLLLLSVCAVLATISVGLGYRVLTLGYREHAVPHNVGIPWPLSRVVNTRQPTVIVLADSSYALLRFFNGRHSSLEEYLSQEYPRAFMPPAMTPRESRLLGLLAGSPLATFSSVECVRTIIGLSGQLASHTTVRTARDFHTRDLREGNSILLGSPSSNPWVSFFDRVLNFQEVDDLVERGEKYFLNKRPQPGELARYVGLSHTGTTGLAYATIALVPNELQTASVLIMQGLHQEGTEAAGLFLSDEYSCATLQRALLRLNANPGSAWFEVLIRSESIAATPGKVDIVAVRVIRPS